MRTEIWISKKIALLIIILSFAFLITIFVATGYHKDLFTALFNWSRDIDREYYKKMKSIEIGMSSKEVIEILGEPENISSEPFIVETHGKYGSGQEYGKKIRNKNKCLIYHHGADIIGHYFIDEKDKVYFINVGGT